MTIDPLHTLQCPRLPAHRARELYDAMCARPGGENVITWHTATCWICKHSVLAHYHQDHGAGCIANHPAPLTQSAVHNGEQPHQAYLPDTTGTCLCPGYQLGGLPPAITDTLNGIDAHDDELCPNCPHPLQRHGATDATDHPYGCWACPCTHNELPHESAFEIPLDDQPAGLLSDPRALAAQRHEIRIRVGWVTLAMPTNESVTIQLRMPDLGLSATIATRDPFWSYLSLRKPCELTMTLTDCWQHDACNPDHSYRVHFVPTT